MKVFISYSDRDHAVAARIAEALKAAGFDVWDDRDVFPGDNWAANVGQALQESSAMVALISPEALRSRWVRREIEYALGSAQYDRRLIPVFLSPVEPFDDEVPWILRQFQGIVLGESEGEQEGSIRELCETLLEAPQGSYQG